MNKLVAQALAKKENGEKGFTLIELLVVVIIIGILAAIAIPVFLNMREGAWKSSVESDVNNAILAVEQAAQANNGSYADLAVVDGEIGDQKIVESEGNTIAFSLNTDEKGYTITGTNVDYGTDKEYVYDSTDGSKTWEDAE